MDELVFGAVEGLRKVGDGREALGVDGGEAKGRAPDVEVEDHGGGYLASGGLRFQIFL